MSSCSVHCSAICSVLFSCMGKLWLFLLVDKYSNSEGKHCNVLEKRSVIGFSSASWIKNRWFVWCQVFFNYDITDELSFTLLMLNEHLFQKTATAQLLDVTLGSGSLKWSCFDLIFLLSHKHTHTRTQKHWILLFIIISCHVRGSDYPPTLPLLPLSLLHIYFHEGGGVIVSELGMNLQIVLFFPKSTFLTHDITDSSISSHCNTLRSFMAHCFSVLNTLNFSLKCCLKSDTA